MIMALQEIWRSPAYQWQYIWIENIHLEWWNSWESVARTGNQKAVAALLRHKDDEKFIIIEQYRYPVAAKVLELVAGLQDKRWLSPEDHLREEVMEETWYTQIDDINFIWEVSGSAGLTSETALLYTVDVSWERWDQSLEESEDISVVEVAMSGVRQLVRESLEAGVLVDPKLTMALYMLDED